MTITRNTLIKLAALGGAQAIAMPYLSSSAWAQTAPVTLKLTYSDTPSHPVAKVMQRFADNVQKRTNGGVKIDVYSVGQLGSQMNILTGLQTGILDLVAHASGFVETLFPKWQVVDLPFIFPDSATAERVLDGPVGQQLLEMLPSKGIYGLGFGTWGWRVIDTTFSHRLSAPAEVKGLKIRVPPGPIFTAMWRTLGASPMSIDLTEVFLSLSQHAIDAVDIPIVALPSTKLFEVVKTVNVTNHQYNVGVLMASKSKLDSLVPAHQDAIRAAAREATVDWRKSVAEGSESASAFVKKRGITIVPVDRDAYRKATEPVYEQFREAIGADLIDLVLKQTGHRA